MKRWFLKGATERQNSKEELRLAKEKLESFFQSTTDAIVEFDTHYKVLMVNPAYERMFGWSQNEVVGRRFPNVPAAYLEETLKLVERVETGHSVAYLETVRSRKDGTLLHVNISLAPIYDDKTGELKSFITVLRDITDHKQTQDLLRKSEKLHIAGQLAAGVAHEIRNPLTSIKGFVQLMQSTGRVNVEHLDIILSEISRIELITKEFVLLAKPGGFNLQTLGIDSVVHPVFDLLTAQASLGNVRLCLDDQTPEVQVTGDPDQLKQVLINIVKNAIEATPPGGTVHLATRSLDPVRVLISVSDCGPGIPSERLSMLGEPFYSTKEHGSGLGLMVSSKIIQSHHGTLRFENNEPHGTVVKIELPRIQ
ncbi:PAS domain S-box protein [Alicyclobacillus tolerans]|uniref:ATP-binding protein n=1 Tax=Alicyclobacillus tolerans TaxID=90970 RepID=UPI001F2288BD|nr:ATP-binding protein [Alicyclobacillus tolerans]MCF8567919.1 PAS domain S-box protein [Alicyclobacillus tolerans]